MECGEMISRLILKKFISIYKQASKLILGAFFVKIYTLNPRLIYWSGRFVGSL
jgi:hypothetical protein